MKKIPNETNNIDDVDIILKLRESGPKYLDNMLNTNKRNSTKNIMLAFEKMYINDEELFESGIDNYIEHLNNNKDTLMWKCLSKTLTATETITYLNKFCNYISTSKYSDLNKLKILKKILLLPHIKSALVNNFNIWDIILNPFLHNIDIGSTEWTKIMKDLQKIVKNIITVDKKLKNSLVIWVSKITNSCISKININVGDYNKSLPSDIFLANLLGLFLTFWKESMGQITTGIWCNLPFKDRIKKLNYNYIISNKCPIKWFDIKIKRDKVNYNFTTEIMFMILNTIRVGYTPTLYRSINLKKVSAELNNEIINTSQFIEHQSGNPAFGFINAAVKEMRAQLNTINELIIMDTKVINNHQLSHWIGDFYSQLKDWIVVNKGKLLDDILYDMLHYINNNKHLFDCSDMYDMFLDIIESKTYTTNIEIKCDALKCFMRSNVFEDFEDENMVSKLANALMNFHMNCGNDMNAKILIYSIMDAYYFDNDNETVISGLLVPMHDNMTITKKFISVILMDYCDVLGHLDKAYDEFYDNEDNDEDDEDDETFNAFVSITNFCGKMISFIGKLIPIIIKNNELKHIILSKEIFSTLATSLNMTLEKLSTKLEYDSTLGMFDDDDDMIDIKIYKHAVRNILHALYDAECDWDSIIQDHSFDISYYEEFDCQNKNRTHKIIETIVNKINNIKQDCDNIPDRFLDPITFTMINEPCLLPGMVGFSNENLFFDKSTIMKSLLIKEENPYTRTNLTIKEFEDFNNLPEIKTHNEKFGEEIDLWKKTIK